VCGKPTRRRFLLTGYENYGSVVDISLFEKLFICVYEFIDNYVYDLPTFNLQ